MSGRPAPLSRLYLLPTVAAIALGLVTLVYRLRQPSFPALPGRGCIVVTYPSPDSIFLPTPYLELNACVHISETLLSLAYHPGTSEPSSGIFEARVEEDPRLWSRAVGIRWLNGDTVQVRYRSDVRFANRKTSFSRGHVVYGAMP
jgi:hypothetical protein